MILFIVTLVLYIVKINDAIYSNSTIVVSDTHTIVVSDTIYSNSTTV